MQFNAEAIQKHLHASELTVEFMHCVSSTNSLLKQKAAAGAPHGLVLAAAEQTEGRGRMGRNFFSPNETGVYFSILLRPDLSPPDSLLITTSAAVAAARVLEKFSGKPAQIKWVNDIYIDGKKVCGILTEAAIAPDGSRLSYAVLGIGINLTSPKHGFPADISNRAGFLLPDCTNEIRPIIVAEIVNEFYSMYIDLQKREFINEYRTRSMLNGMDVNVIKSDRTLPATALYVTEDLSLAVQYENGDIEYLSSGDVSIRHL